MAKAKYTKTTTKTRVKKTKKSTRRCNMCGGKGYISLKK